MFLADAYKDGNEYPYFTEEEYRNKVYNLYVIRDNTYNYYIQVKDNYYVKLSDFVSTNYKKMEIVSTLEIFLHFLYSLILLHSYKQVNMQLLFQKKLKQAVP